MNIEPIVKWLSDKPFDRFTETSMVQGTLFVRLFDYSVSTTRYVGIGGSNNGILDEANANALNDLMAQQWADEAALEKADREFNAERAARGYPSDAPIPFSVVDQTAERGR